MAAPGTLRLARLGTRGPLAGTLAALLGSVGRRPIATRTHPTARGGLTARVPRGIDSDGAHLTAVRLLTTRVGVLTWNRRPQAMPGRGPRTCGWGPRVAPEQASLRAPRPGTLGAARWSCPAGAGRRPELLEGSVRFARCGSLSTSGWPWAVSRPRPHSGTTGTDGLCAWGTHVLCTQGLLVTRSLDHGWVRSLGDGRAADAVVMEAAEIRLRRSCWAVLVPSAAGICWVTGLRCHFSPMGLGTWCAGRARYSGSSLRPSGL